MTELSLDIGGPRREFFRLLSKEASLQLFTGDNVKFFKYDTCALEVMPID